MNRINTFLFIAFIALITTACTQKKQQAASIQPIQENSQTERAMGHNEGIKDYYKKDSTAIGNICLNITREEFERQRIIFMRETPKLGGYKIKSVNGLFYDDRLAAVQIISYQQDVHKRGGISIDGWYSMYNEKYGNQYKSNKRKFDFEKGTKCIVVTDLSASDIPFASFEQFMENPIKYCYVNEPLYSEDNRNLLLIIELMKRLPKSRKEYYKKKERELQEEQRKLGSELDYRYVIASNNLYEELRKEVNAIIERNNEINSEKHKNDPSWSVIIVAYQPLCDKYDTEKRINGNKRKHLMETERQKELNKL